MTKFLTAAILVAALASHAFSADANAVRDDNRQVADLLQRSYIFVGGGSGVLISADGLILSNDHVTGGQWEWQVRLADGRSYQAKVLGTDPIGDISLLQIQTEDPDFAHVSMGTVDDIRPGMPVLAIGNPFGLGDVDDTPTVTVGHLGSHRLVRGVYTDCLQLDAAVNPGNSGGPLLTRDGVLLGINGQIRTRTGMRINSGIGLAIACTQLQDFLPHLKTTKSGYVHHSAIPEGLELEQRPSDGAVVVAAWEPDNEADQTLLAVGDEFISIAHRPVTSQDVAIGLFGSLPWTKTLRIPTMVRDATGQTRSVEVPSGRTDIPGKAWHGIKVHTQDGAVHVRSVDAGSPAFEAGLSAGWKIISANDRAIERRIDWLKVLVPLDVGDQLQLECVDHAGETHHLEFWLPAEGR